MQSRRNNVSPNNVAITPPRSALRRKHKTEPTVRSDQSPNCSIKFRFRHHYRPSCSLGCKTSQLAPRNSTLSTLLTKTRATAGCRTPARPRPDITILFTHERGDQCGSLLQHPCFARAHPGALAAAARFCATSRRLFPPKTLTLLPPILYFPSHCVFQTVGTWTLSRVRHDLASMMSSCEGVEGTQEVEEQALQRHLRRAACLGGFPSNTSSTYIFSPIEFSQCLYILPRFH